MKKVVILHHRNFKHRRDMKARTLLFVAMAAMSLNGIAQDDMYFVPKKKSKTEKNVSTSSTEKNLVRKDGNGAPVEYYTGQLRDVDDYNRRGKTGRNVTIMTETDTFEVDESRLVMDEQGNYVLAADNGRKAPRLNDGYYDDYYDDYLYSARLSRFHGYGYPYYAIYDPFYYDPYYSFYYDPWYYGSYWNWYGGWHGYYSWYNPWYYGYGWGGHYAWYPTYHHHSTSGGGTPHRGMNGGRGYASNGGSLRGTSSSSRGYTSSRTAGNALTNRGTSYGSRGDRGAARGTVSNRSINTTPRSSSYGSSSRTTVTTPRTTSSSSRSFSTSSSRSSSSSSSRSGGGFSSSSRSGGGFSGGSSSRGGGGSSRGGGGRGGR